jgi:hypothetical protein
METVGKGIIILLWEPWNNRSEEFKWEGWNNKTQKILSRYVSSSEVLHGNS